MQRLRLIATCCLCFCCSSCAVHLTALGAALAVAGLLQLSPCTHGLTADADAMAAIVAALNIFQVSLEDRNAALSLHPHEHAVVDRALHACKPILALLETSSVPESTGLDRRSDERKA